jgi:signal peptidase I
MGNAERPAHGPLRAHIIVRPLAMRPPRPRKLITLALGLGVVACLWVYLAPVALGGSTTYVVTEGISMEPRFHTGDLALVRRQSSYHVGEIVAYYSKAFHTVVLHRIVGRAGARYIFKGDNNNFVDFEHPAASQLIGALWVHLPGVGGVLDSVRSPALIGGLAALGTLLFAGGVFTRRRRRRRRQARAGAGAALTPGIPTQRSLPPVASVLAPLMLALVPFAVLALVAFTRPSSTRVPVSLPYKQSGTLSYTARATPGPTYANNLAVTGDPLFAHVVNTAEMRFAYEFNASGAQAIAGQVSIYAEIISSSGWKTTLELGHASHFHGDRAVVSAPFDLTSLLALVRSVQLSTGVGGSYSLMILPRVSAGGSVGTLPVHASFSPQYHFTLTPLEVEPIVASASASSPGERPSANAFEQSTSSSVTGKRSEALSLTFGVARLAVDTARAIALAGIAVVVLALLAVLAFLRPQVRDETDTIRSRYGRLIVPVASVSPLPGMAVIDVADMDSLVRIAEHYDRSILQESTEAGDAFWVSDESGQFRYALGQPAPTTTEHGVLARSPAPGVTHEHGSNGGGFDEADTAVFGAIQETVANGAYPTAFSAPYESTTNRGNPAPHDTPQEIVANGTYPAAFSSPQEAAANGSYPAAFSAPQRGFADEADTTEFEAVATSLADAVYADELELGIIGYEARRTGSPERSRTSPSLPAWTGSSG